MNTYYKFRGLLTDVTPILNFIQTMSQGHQPPFVFVTQPIEFLRIEDDNARELFSPIRVVYECIIMTDSSFVAAHPELFRDFFI